MKNSKQKVHLLHIGKTGGSAIKWALRELPETQHFSIILHGHGVSLNKIPPGDAVVFFLRDPISRFISGFYSRKRMGRPRYYSEWTKKEKTVFDRFDSPGALAVALANKEPLALEAMTCVRHLRRYDKWYFSTEYFQSRIDDIFFVGFQESLDIDFTALKVKLGLPDHITLPSDDVNAHKNPCDLDRKIDEAGLSALRDWYATDYRFIRACKDLMSGREARGFRGQSPDTLNYQGHSYGGGEHR